MKNLLDLIDGFRGRRIGVFGDIMQDIFTYGTVERISPEAPVPIVDVSYAEHRLGGCGNVTSNLAALGAEPYVFAVVGCDAGAESIAGLLSEKNIRNMTVKDASRPTTTKERIVAHNQQVARLDRERRRSISPELEKEVLASAGKVLDSLDVIILSDYGKGFLTDSLCRALIQSSGKVVVDPKAPFGKYKGARTVTPNFEEFRRFGKVDVEKSPELMLPYAANIIKDNGFSSLLVTMGEDGMAFFENGRYAKVAAVNNGYDVVDITGAGDTAIAVYSLALAAGAGDVEAMRLANYAAARVVKKLGTATCSPDELRAMVKKYDGFQEVRA